MTPSLPMWSQENCLHSCIYAFISGSIKGGDHKSTCPIFLLSIFVFMIRQLYLLRLHIHTHTHMYTQIYACRYTHTQVYLSKDLKKYSSMIQLKASLELYNQCVHLQSFKTESLKACYIVCVNKFPSCRWMTATLHILFNSGKYF